MSLQMYPSYSPVVSHLYEAIPAHWELTSLRSLVEPCSAKNENAFVQDYLSVVANVGVMPYAEKGDVGNKKPEDLSKCKLVSAGDIVVNSMNYGIGSFGLSRYSGVCSPVYIIMRPKVGLVEPRYALRLFEHRSFQKYAQSFGNGILAHRAAISWDTLKALRVARPPLAEQSAIVAFLDRQTAKIDALIEEQQRLIALLDEKRQAVISHAVTKGLNPNAPMKESSIDWLGKFPAHWDILPLRRVVRQFVDYRGATPTKVDEGVPLVTATQIKNGRVDHALDPVFISEEEYAQRMTRGFPAVGDLLLTTEAPLGEAALVEHERVAPGQRIILMKANERMHSPYLHAHFRSLFGQSELWTRASGSTASGIRADRLRASNVLVPPISEQQAIVGFIENKTAAFDETKIAAENAIRLLHERRSALISAAVTGKIDVRGLVEEQAEAA